MELRFVEGNFEHGKFKLQYRHDWDGGEEKGWIDVPCVKEEKEQWCEHVVLDRGRYFLCEEKEPFGDNKKCADYWIMCPICGAVKPSEAGVKANKGASK
jgi:hypothetical protein